MNTKLKIPDYEALEPIKNIEGVYIAYFYVDGN